MGTLFFGELIKACDVLQKKYVAISRAHDALLVPSGYATTTYKRGPLPSLPLSPLAGLSVGGSTVGQTGIFFTQVKLLARGSGGCMAQRPEARWQPQGASKGPASTAAFAGDGSNLAC